MIVSCPLRGSWFIISTKQFFFRFYVMGPTEINLYGIAHVKLDFILLQKMYVILRVKRFVWTTNFTQCVGPAWSVTKMECLFRFESSRCQCDIMRRRIPISKSEFNIRAFTYSFWKRLLWKSEYFNIKFCDCEHWKRCSYTFTRMVSPAVHRMRRNVMRKFVFLCI